MQLNKNRLYVFLLTACFLGYVWLYYNSTKQQNTVAQSFGCLFKKFTNVPCPACGNTRAVLLIAKGSFYQALIVNPLGYIVAVALLVVPIWIFFDVAFKKNSLYLFINNLPKFATPKVTWLLVVLLLLNWAWNIVKNN
jgi:hypothetical protein